MRSIICIAAVVAVGACADKQPDAKQIADAQSKSWIGPTARWKLDPALVPTEIQHMRDRAYSFCLARPSEKDCLSDQDHSLFEYASAFHLVRIYRTETNPTYAYAVAHKLDPGAFGRVHDYCRAVYKDNGSQDARSLGPCMAAGLGSDFFGVIPVR